MAIIKFLSKIDCNLYIDTEFISAINADTIKKVELEAGNYLIETFDTEKSKNRKKDEEKVEIVHKIAEFMQTFVQNAEIVNEGQKISFEIGENSYSLTLTKHRNTKK